MTKNTSTEQFAFMVSERKRVRTPALFAAAAIHVAILSMPFKDLFDLEQRLRSKTLQVYVSDETVSADEPEQPDESPETAQPAPLQNTDTDTDNIEASDQQAEKPDVIPALTKALNTDESPVVDVSINSDVFKSFLRKETERALRKNPDAIGDFSATFIRPSETETPSFDNGQPALGGGIYNVRKDGQTCQSMQMVPQTFDDMVYGTMTTGGNCKRDKPLIDLVNKDGTIKNSDQFDD